MGECIQCGSIIPHGLTLEPGIARNTFLCLLLKNDVNGESLIGRVGNILL